MAERLITSPELQGLVRLSEDLSRDYLEYHGILPLRLSDGHVRIACWHETVDVQALDDLRRMFGCEPVLVRLPEVEVRTAIQRTYGSDPDNRVDRYFEGVREGMGTSSDIALDDLLSLANEAPVVRMVNLLLLEALDARASDVHLESRARGLTVRYRLDGVLHEVSAPPAGLADGIISRIKIMADLDIAERRAPQDGRIQLRLKKRDIDVRISTMPTLHGESVVLRLLDAESRRGSLEELGMTPETCRAFEGAISKSHGIILVTGPTGSGKTTTLYAAVERLRTGGEKILTVEDPIEYELPGVAQIQVNSKVGLTFATALRAMLRQDPDVLLVGEIRDEETAEISVHAALTGHLVLTTLHTNDAPSALSRMLDLGIPEYLVASTVEAVLAQRLVRRICRDCREIVGDARALGNGDGVPPSHSAYRGLGCDSCRGTGYRGRTGIFELLLVDDQLRGQMKERPDANSLRQYAVNAGMRTMLDDAGRLVREGTTTREEVARVLTS